MLGFDPQWLLTCTDTVELELVQAAIRRAAELEDLRDSNMAVRIANALLPSLGKMLKGRVL